MFFSGTGVSAEKRAISGSFKGNSHHGNTDIAGPDQKLISIFTLHEFNPVNFHLCQ
jgi:hypothetical protein